MAENSHKISQIQIGDTTYDICDATARSHTITDQNYTIIDNNFPISSDTVSANSYTRGLLIKDSDGQDRNYVRNIAIQNGNLQGLQLETRRVINGTNKYNSIKLYIDGNGTPSVQLMGIESWRSALGLSCSNGDVISFGLYSTTGHITNSGRSIVFDMVLPKFYPGAKTGSRFQGSIIVRCQGGYRYGSTFDTGVSIDTTDVTITNNVAHIKHTFPANKAENSYNNQAANFLINSGASLTI